MNPETRNEAEESTRPGRDAMHCHEVVRELAVPTGELDASGLAEHLARCPRCASWAEDAARLDRLWEATRPAEPFGARWETTWADVSRALDQAPTPEPAHEEDPAHGLHRKDLRRALDAALNRLTPATRTTFVLFAEAGLSYKEISDALDVPIGTVMSRLHYARHKLQSYLEGIEGL